MNYQVLSFNYKKCDLDTREQIAFKDDDAIKRYLNLLNEFEFIHEAYIVNTCNRVEIVTSSSDNISTYYSILGLLSKTTGADFYHLEKTVLRLEDQDAVRHIFKVVSSLDSMVVGEAQITGQVKDAFKLSYKNGTAGKELNRVISYAIKCASEIRNITSISQNPVSIASVAVAQAKQDMGGSLAGMTGVVVGSGEMGRLAAKHLLRANADVLLMSRTREHAENLAFELESENVKVVNFEDLSKYINRYRLLFTATSSPEPIINSEITEQIEAERFWFDMAIPRDIDEVRQKNIKLYRIDDLRTISKTNHALREEQALAAAEVVDRYVDNFYLWLQALAVEPLIKQMRLSINDVVKSEVQRSVKKGYLPRQFSDNANKMIVQVFDKFLHEPTRNLRELAKKNDSQNVINALADIFGLDIEVPNPAKYKKESNLNQKPNIEMLKKLKGEGE